jgi:hypothetical protein
MKDFTKELAISSGRIPPNAVEFEKLVLGTCLIDSKGLKETIKKCNLKDLKSECFSSEVGYYMNAKDILWITWRRHKKNYAKRFPNNLETLINCLNSFINMCENSNKKWSDDIDLINHFEMYCNLHFYNGIFNV